MKKILCAVLAATFLIAAPALTYAADLTDEQLGELGKYHILEGDENGNLHLDDNITRNFSRNLPKCSEPRSAEYTGSCTVALPLIFPMFLRTIGRCGLSTRRWSYNLWRATATETSAPTTT